MYPGSIHFSLFEGANYPLQELKNVSLYYVVNNPTDPTQKPFAYFDYVALLNLNLSGKPMMIKRGFKYNTNEPIKPNEIVQLTPEL